MRAWLCVYAIFWFDVCINLLVWCAAGPVPGKRSFEGVLEGGQTANYMLFVMQGADFFAIPAGEWYNFKPTIQYSTFSLEEAEARMANRARAAEGALHASRTCFCSRDKNGLVFGREEQLSTVCMSSWGFERSPAGVGAGWPV